MLLPKTHRGTGRSVQLHRFCVASESAYAAVAYLRIVDVEDSVTTSLVIAKTKVAPIKKLPIPRLELCGAVFFGQANKLCWECFPDSYRQHVRLDRQFSGP